MPVILPSSRALLVAFACLGMYHPLLRDNSEGLARGKRLPPGRRWLLTLNRVYLGGRRTLFRRGNGFPPRRSAFLTFKRACFGDYRSFFPGGSRFPRPRRALFSLVRACLRDKRAFLGAGDPPPRTHGRRIPRRKERLSAKTCRLHVHNASLRPRR